MVGCQDLDLKQEHFLPTFDQFLPIFYPWFLGIKVDMGTHGQTEYTINDICFPTNILETRWGIHGNSEIQNPISRSGNGITTLSNSVVTPDFSTIDPDTDPQVKAKDATNK